VRLLSAERRCEFSLLIVLVSIRGRLELLFVFALPVKKETRDDGQGCHRLTGHDGTMPVGMRRQEAGAWPPSAASRGQ